MSMHNLAIVFGPTLFGELDLALRDWKRGMAHTSEQNEAKSTDIRMSFDSYGDGLLLDGSVIWRVALLTGHQNEHTGSANLGTHLAVGVLRVQLQGAGRQARDVYA
ncbi:hypothetical protein C8R43DRAFT_945312 [Mycena crocata]|nr:hypothetical protein C8R43DRAFT_945312 [Mycena crocata]